MRRGKRSQSTGHDYTNLATPNKKKQGTVKLGFRDKIRKGSTVLLLHTKNKQESHEQSHHTQIYQKSKNKNKSRTNSPPATGSISFEAISEGNEAWSEIPQIRGMENYTRSPSSNHRQDLEPDNIPLRSK